MLGHDGICLKWTSHRTFLLSSLCAVIFARITLAHIITHPTSSVAATMVTESTNIKKRTIKLDDDGDLIFITQTQKLRVSSKVLIRASSALAMLVQYCKDTSLDLSSDHPIAVYIILSILHLKSSAVPKCVSLELLVAIAKVCGWYRCYAGVGRWPCVWMEMWNESEKDQWREWLVISHVFRHPEIFCWSSKLAVLRVISIHDMETPCSSKRGGSDANRVSPSPAPVCDDRLFICNLFIETTEQDLARVFVDHGFSVWVQSFPIPKTFANNYYKDHRI